MSREDEFEPKHGAQISAIHADRVSRDANNGWKVSGPEGFVDILRLKRRAAVDAAERRAERVGGPTIIKERSIKQNFPLAPERRNSSQDKIQLDAPAQDARRLPAPEYAFGGWPLVAPRYLFTRSRATESADNTSKDREGDDDSREPQHNTDQSSHDISRFFTPRLKGSRTTALAPVVAWPFLTGRPILAHNLGSQDG